jgi:hypothetical protein
MRTTFTLAALVAGAAAQFCPEASRFGFTTVTPTKLSVGQVRYPPAQPSFASAHYHADLHDHV